MNPLHLLILVSGIAHINFAGTRLAVMLYAVHLNASPATVGILAALFGVLGVTTSVATGRWIDRVGSRRPMFFCALLMSAATFTAFAWDELAALFIVSIVVGTAYNVYFLANQAQIGRYGGPQDRVANFSLGMQGNAMANFIAPLVTGFAIDGISFGYTFLMLSVLPLLPALMIALNKLTLTSSGTATARARRSGESVWELLRMPVLRRVFLMALLANVGWNLYTFLMPVYGAQIHLSASQIGLIMSTFSFASVVSRLLAPALSRHLTPWQILIGAILLGAAGFFVTSFLVQVSLLVIFAFWMGLALGICAPMAIALLYDASPPERIGEVQGLRLAMLNGLQTVVPLTAGMIGAALGVGPVFWVVAALLAGGAYVARGQWHNARPQHKTSGH